MCHKCGQSHHHDASAITLCVCVCLLCWCSGPLKLKSGQNKTSSFEQLWFRDTHNLVSTTHASHVTLGGWGSKELGIILPTRHTLSPLTH